MKSRNEMDGMVGIDNFLGSSRLGADITWILTYLNKSNVLHSARMCMYLEVGVETEC